MSPAEAADGTPEDEPTPAEPTSGKDDEPEAPWSNGDEAAGDAAPES